MTTSKKIGKYGEDIASKILLKKGYLILARNWQGKWCEIDIVTRSPEGTLIFCEVKTITDAGTFSEAFKPEDHLTDRKLKNMIRAAEIFTLKHPELVLEDKGWQMDLVAVTLKPDRTINVRHYKNIP